MRIKYFAQLVVIVGIAASCSQSESRDQTVENSDVSGEVDTLIDNQNEGEWEDDESSVDAEGFQELLSFFAAKEWGSEPEEDSYTAIPYLIAKEYILEPNDADVYFMPDILDEPEATEFDDRYYIGAVASYEFSENIQLLMCHVHGRTAFNYLDGTLLFSYTKNGELIDYVPYDLDDEIPKAGGGLGTAYNTTMGENFKMTYNVQHMDIMSRDVDDDERAEHELDPEVTGVMITSSHETGGIITINPDGTFDVEENMTTQREESKEFY